MAIETQYYSRLPKSLQLTKGAPTYDSVSGFESVTATAVRQSIYSDDGRYFAYSLPQQGVFVVDPDTGKVVQHLNEVVDAVEIALSPKSTFILTWERPKKDEASGNYNNNLRIWNTQSGELIESFLQKPQRPWSIQYTTDEKYCARLVAPGLLQFYENNNFRTPYAKLKVDGMSEFVLSPGQNYSVAVFVPLTKAKPAAVRVYQIPNFSNPVSQKTFFKADKVTMKWNKLGTALLVLASTDVDQTGKSYYGETNLYLLGIAGSYDSRIELDKEGTIHGFDWSPNSREFGVVYGTMPAKTAIFDARGNTVHSFPPNSRNCIFFSPHGRFVAVAGFGNLQGSMDIYDRQRQFAKVSTIEASNTVVCQWSPDGRHILTATTSPRLRVDNGVRIWHYSGKMIFAVDHDELLGVGWRPQEVAKFPLRSTLSPAPAAHKSVESVKSIKAAPAQKAGAYRPPHARVAGVTHAPTSLYEREQAKYTIPGASQPRGVPGARVPGASSVNNNSTNNKQSSDDQLSKSAARNKKKREQKKKNADESTTTGSSARASPQPVATPPARASTPGANATANGEAASSTDAPTGSSLEDKKIRSLLKKLRAIEELKMRQASGDKLENTQVQKIATEEAVQKELQTLGWKNL